MNLTPVVRSRVARVLNRIAVQFGLRVDLRQDRPTYPFEEGRFEYQRRFHNFDLDYKGPVLDIGSGNYPFPHASILVDRFLDRTHHRGSVFVRPGKPVVVGDIHALPFGTQSFDFVFCSHLLEHVDDPLQACSELMRVARRGYIETPALAKDMLFSWARGMHKWHVTAIAGSLIFFEYDERHLDGIQSTAWRDLIESADYHPLQEAFHMNQDVFNTMLRWDKRFRVIVFRCNGDMQVLAEEREHATAPARHEPAGVESCGF